MFYFSPYSNFEFLINVQKEFYLKYPPSQIVTANAYAYDKSFRKTLSNLMHYCNTSGGIDSDLKASGLRAEVQSIKNILDINIDLLMRRGVVMENLIEQSEDLFNEWALLLFDQAQLLDGATLKDPSAFVHRLNKLLEPLIA